MQKKKLDHGGVSAFCESVAMMMQSGIQMGEAIELLRSGKHGPGGILAQALEEMSENMSAGLGLCKSMEKSGIFPDYALQMVGAGAQSGNLEDTLFRLARYYRDQKTVSEKLRGAVVYPASMLMLIAAVLAAMLTMVLPTFSRVYDSLTGSLAASSYGYVRLAYGVCWAALGLMVLLALALGVGLLLWKSKKRGVVEKALCRLPLCRDILESRGLFRFTCALATFIASGEMQDQAVNSSMSMVDCPLVEEKLKACVADMEQGHGIAQAAYDQGLFEPVYGRMLLAGERSGSLEHALERLTELEEDNCGRLVDRLVGLADPLLSGVLMLTIALALMSVMLPLIGMMNSVG